MKEFISAVRLTIVCLVFFSGIYTLAVWGIAQVATGHGKGEIAIHNGKPQYINVGQLFTYDGYFWGRPSAVNYNAAGSGGSNKAPSNAEYLQTIQARIDTFMARSPTVKREDIPADLVTASGSGLDPHISVQAARVQAARIASVRDMSIENVELLIATNTEAPLFGIMGTEKINVVKLNIALDEIKKP